MKTSGPSLPIQPGTQYGSNPGGIYVDETGVQFYLKHYSSPEQAHVEVLAARVCTMMGIATVLPEIRVVDGSTYVVSRWNHHLKRMVVDDFTRLNETQASQVGQIFCGAVLMKHWDVVGAELDNILCHEETGDIYAIDTGGALHLRARGGHKEFGADIAELRTLREIRPAALVFNTVFEQFPGAYSDGLEAVRRLDDDELRREFRVSGLVNEAELCETMLNRKAMLLSQT